MFSHVEFSITITDILCVHMCVNLSRCGRCKLNNVKVLNKGIDWDCGDNTYWKHDVQRFEALKIILHGNAEFEASDVTLQVRFT